MTTLIETMADAIVTEADIDEDEDYRGIANPKVCAYAVLMAIEAAGYRVVPVEPTEEMRANAVGMKANHINVDLEWANMLAAAPKVTE